MRISLAPPSTKLSRKPLASSPPRVNHTASSGVYTCTLFANTSHREKQQTAITTTTTTQRTKKQPEMHNTAVWFVHVCLCVCISVVLCRGGKKTDLRPIKRSRLFERGRNGFLPVCYSAVSLTHSRTHTHTGLLYISGNHPLPVQSGMGLCVLHTCTLPRRDNTAHNRTRTHTHTDCTHVRAIGVIVLLSLSLSHTLSLCCGHYRAHT